MLKALSHTQYIMQVMPWVGKVVSVVFQFIPMPVLYGVFLYMGVASLNGVQVGRPDHLISPLYLETPRQTHTHTYTQQPDSHADSDQNRHLCPANKQTKARCYWTAFFSSVSPPRLYRSPYLDSPVSPCVCAGQFMDRLQLLLMPAKHQPDLIYLRHVPQRRIHLFTFIQVLCLALLWILKSTVAAIIFPVMVGDRPGGGQV